MAKKRIKKYNRYKNIDIIHPLEYETSVFKNYFSIFRKCLEKGLTIDNVLQHCIMLHRFTFMENLHFLNVRTIIEACIDKIDKYEDEYIDTHLSEDLKIHYKQRELLRLFCDEAELKIKSIKTRTLYAKIHQDMIVDHQIYLNLTNSSILRFADMDSVKDALKTTRKKLAQKDIYKNQQEGNYPLWDVDGSITYTKDVINNGQKQIQQ